MRLLLPACSAMALVACSPNVGSRPVVYVDEDFTREEDVHIEEAFASWEERVPGLEIQTIPMAHAELEAAATVNTSSGVVFLLRERSIDGLMIGRTWVSIFGSAKTIIAEDQVMAYARAWGTEHPNVYRQDVAHEMGHALGLSHDPGEESVMVPLASDAPVDGLVHCVDAERAASNVGLPVPSCKESP
jgi:hypothetical protein